MLLAFSGNDLPLEQTSIMHPFDILPDLKVRGFLNIAI